MKNIYILPTDKPSRLHLESNGLKLARTQYTLISQNIYITSDEEIKEGDWHLVWLRDKWEVLNYMPSIGYRKECLGKEVCKIILTTDSDLIKYGVQAIPNDFLEWFVKNPSCKEVEVREIEVEDYVGFAGHTSYPTFHKEYKIIIPKEEPKQIDEKGNPLTYWGGLEEARANSYINFAKSNEDVSAYSFVAGWDKGAKWQQERSYSEAIEFGKWLDENAQNRAYYQMETMSMEELFQQFKNK